MKKLKPLVRTAPLVLVVIAALLLQGQTYYFPMIFKNRPVPLYSTSYYIQNGNPDRMYVLGCELGTRDAATPGTQDSLIILDFGKMWVLNGNQYGIRTFSDPNNGYARQFLSFADLMDRAQWFAKGYWNCSANDKSSRVTVGIGTNSFDFFNQPKDSQIHLRSIAMDFGRNWAGMVKNLNQWGLQYGYASQILFTGAIDIEWAGKDPDDGLYYWQSPYVVDGWVEAFDGNDDNGGAIYFNYGACVGCPVVPDLDWQYHNDLPWSQYGIWKVSWGAQPAFAVPEIYRNDSYLARQWAAVSKYGSLYLGSRIVFTGAMTQMQACQQRGGTECNTLDNTPAEGWGQLVDAINAETFTAQPFLQYSTDIKWQFK
ncbi:MAG TPA: hypothetical protein DCP32_06590 [Anaerolineaceae bacterium]|nr:MAG: hypothetical protein A2X24_12800 [Chloroflexi bacterium GWB2_54_36]HAL16417.1 hypothetical protein [Anaerolineaceae bacterium]HBA92845.1 hypothetical protein [Anaerolineaceae bacterium]